MTRIIISDEFGQHGIDIKTAISNGYGSDISDQIEIISNWSPAYNRAVADEEIIALIRSTTGVTSYVSNAANIYPRVQTFFPLGSNTFTQLTNFANNEPPVIVVSGAGDFTNSANDRNNTGYGKGLEFWDRDLTVSDADDQSSFSNGYILGKLLKIKDTLNCTWWEARYRARITAYRIEPNRETSMWDLRNGYGRIDVTAALGYVGLIPPDPYLQQESLPEVYLNPNPQTFIARCSSGKGPLVKRTVQANTVGSVVSEQVADSLALLLARQQAEADLICNLDPLPFTQLLSITHKTDWTNGINNN